MVFFTVYYCQLYVFRIVSPICLRTCFVEALSIPENNSPVYSMAMRNVVLSVTNLSPKDKVINFYHKPEIIFTFYLND